MSFEPSKKGNFQLIRNVKLDLRYDPLCLFFIGLRWLKIRADGESHLEPHFKSKVHIL
jgi:hypothetical protein